MPKPKVKPMNEYIENYLISVIPGALKTKRYWVKQGYDKNHATKNAVNYAIGQMAAGLGNHCDKKSCVNLYREMAVICNAFADLLEGSP